MKRMLICLCVLLLCAVTAAADEIRQELFTGNVPVSGAWQDVLTLSTAGDDAVMDMNETTQGCCFSVKYQGTSGKLSLSLQLPDGEWVTIDAPQLTEKVGRMGWRSDFTWDQMIAACGDILTQVTALRISSTDCVGTMTLTGVVYTAPDPTLPLQKPVTLMKGSISGQGTNSWITCVYTAHAGGDWDATRINRDGEMTVTWAGSEGGMKLVLGSVSGGRSWVQVTPDTTQDNGDGTWTAHYSGLALQRAFGSDFSRLDQVILSAASEQRVTLKQVVWTPGFGEPINTGDGSWAHTDARVAIIGDSIVHNGGSWSTLLGVPCDNWGIGGQNTRHCLKRFHYLAEAGYDTVIFLACINDVGHGITAEETAANQLKMAEAVWAVNPDARIITVSILPTATNWYAGMQGRIDAINALLQAWAASDDRVTWCAPHDAFLGEDGYGRPELYTDGLHPNAAGYAIITEYLSPLLK